MTHYWIDTLERLAWTFVQAFLAALTAGGLDIVEISALESAALAGLAAVLSAVKSIAAHRLEQLGTAQLIPFVSGTYSHGGEPVNAPDHPDN